MHTSNSSQVQEKKGKEDVDSTNKKKFMMSHQKKRPEENSSNTKHFKDD